MPNAKKNTMRLNATLLALFALPVTFAAPDPFALTDGYIDARDKPDPFALTDAYIDARDKRTPAAAPGVQFSGVFSDGAVLQRGVAVAVYGSVAKASADVVTVTVTDQTGKTETYASPVATLGGDADAWRVELKPREAGGDFSIRAAYGADATTIANVTFGDVFFCSGQSNAWLVMNFALERNETYAAVRAGRYDHVRMRTQTRLNISDGAASYLAPPPPAYDPAGGFPEGGWLRATGGAEDVDNTVAQMSAMCWFFAAALTDVERAAGRDPAPLGLVHSSWGGTIAEMWLPNATLYGASAGCLNTTGGPPYQRKDYANGALYNGMVRPWVNYSVAGVLWYQGENNLFQCADDGGAENGPGACGVLEERTGYACLVSRLVTSWREAWGDATLPFGVVELAGGTSEGFSRSMGAFRHAQAAVKAHARTFVAAGHDVGDPWSGSEARCHEPDAPYACQREDGSPNDTPYTKFFMGSIHPRTKKWVGDRLAFAYRALVGAAPDAAPRAGPTLAGCRVDGGSLVLAFDEALLGDDGVRAWPSAAASGAPTDALMVRYGDAWRAAAIAPQHPFDEKNGTRLANFASATVALDGDNVTGVRYGWADRPFCIVDNVLEPCAPNGGPLMLAKNLLPALPFWAEVAGGECASISSA